MFWERIELASRLGATPSSLWSLYLNSVFRCGPVMRKALACWAPEDPWPSVTCLPALRSQNLKFSKVLVFLWPSSSAWVWFIGNKSLPWIVYHLLTPTVLVLQPMQPGQATLFFLVSKACASLLGLAVNSRLWGWLFLVACPKLGAWAPFPASNLAPPTVPAAPWFLPTAAPNMVLKCK